MAEITDITAQVKDKTRCNIYLDGRFYCGLKLETVMRYRLKKGQAVTAEELNEIQLESEKSDALDKALSYISLTMKTEKDVRSYLKRKGYLPDVEDHVVDKMKEYGYIDDTYYGKLYADSAGKNVGKRMIEIKLRQKGLSEEEARSAADGVSSQTEEETAKRIFEKYMRGKEYNKETLYKAFRHLLSKGFEYETAKDVIAHSGGDDEDL